MILRQTLHTSPAIASSYLFGCGSKGVGVVVDPVAKPEFYLDSAAELGMQVRYVIDTHIHADHLSSAMRSPTCSASGPRSARSA
jgi:glyoxylase-like metal-dependent hydrolase (beta-lactamase superfamily II)